MNNLRKLAGTRSFALFAVCYAAFTGIWLLFMWQLGFTRLAAEVYRIAGNALIVFIPYWFLAPRWRPAAVVPVWLLAAWCVANVWYYRFWHDLLSPASLTMTGNVGGLLLNSIKGVWKWADLAYVVIPAAVTVLSATVFAPRRLSGRYGAGVRAAYVLTAVAVTLGGELLTSRSEIKYQMAEFGHYDKGLLAETADRHVRETCDNMGLLRNHGLLLFLGHYIGDFIELKNSEIELTAEERAEIDAQIAANLIAPTDSLSGKNLVVVVVESLNSEVVGKSIGSHEITPTLNALVEAEGTVSALNVVSQIKDGCSGDGQLIINTGLMPLRKGSAAISFAEINRFPNLREQLPDNYTATAVLADMGSEWKERQMFMNYGFDRILSRADADEGDYEGRGCDGAMFARAAAVADTIKEPFFMELVTISMHVPYVEKEVGVEPWLAQSGIEDEGLVNFYNVTHYFDRELGAFIERLKERGVWERTMLVVVSDHNTQTFDNMPEFVPVLFIAANSGRTERIERVTGQINIFPTLLELMGRRADARAYSGLAPSMLDERVNGSTDGTQHEFGPLTQQAKALIIRGGFELSDKIHRGGYFGKQ